MRALFFAFYLAVFTMPIFKGMAQEPEEAQSQETKPFRILCHGPIICAQVAEILGEETIFQKKVEFKEVSLKSPLPKDVLSYDIFFFMGQEYIEKHHQEIAEIFFKRNEDVFYVGQNALYSLAYPRPNMHGHMEKELLTPQGYKNYDYDAYFFFPLIINRTYDQLLGFLSKYFDVSVYRIADTFANKAEVYQLEEDMAKECNKKRVIFSFSQYGLSNFFVHLGMKAVVETGPLLVLPKIQGNKIYVRSPYIWQKNLQYPPGAIVWNINKIHLYPMIKPGIYLHQLFSEGLRLCQNI